MAQMSLQQAVELGLAHHRAGRLRIAGEMYDQVLQYAPDHVDALHLKGIVEHQSGRSEESATLIRRAIALAPNVAVMHFNLSEALRALGRREQAAAAVQQAVALEPAYFAAHNNLSMILVALGRLDEAVESARRAIALEPGQAAAHNNLANALRLLGRTEESIESALQALGLQPDFPEALNNLALGYARQDRVVEAIIAYRRAIKLRPDFAEALSNLGALLARGGKLPEAIECFQRAIRIRPDHAEAYNNLAGALRQDGQLDQAVLCYEKAISLRSPFAEARVNLALTLKDLQRHDEAIKQLDAAIVLDPEFAEAHYATGAVRKEQMRLDDAAAAYERTLAVDPAHFGAQSALGIVRMEQGRLDEAMDLMRRSLENRRDWQIHSNLCLLSNYHPGLSGRDVLQEHLSWSSIHGVENASLPLHPNDRSPDRRLRIGYISPDFRSHAVSHFVEPVLASHDRSRFEVFCYSHVAKPDAMTHHLTRLSDTWRDIYAVEIAELEQLIRQDKIDILVDLAGHTAHNRLIVFARKPAPVQVSMIGYPSTTGMRQIDYKIADAISDPPGADQYYAESLFRLDGTFWVFRPIDDLEGVGQLPARNNGFITFGSINNFAKITPAVLDLWGQILRAVPASRLHMQASALGSPSTRDYALQSLARNGVDPSRVTITGWTDFAGYIDLIRSFDIALDPFPFNGGTTTCHLLFYGAPLVTLAGQRQVSRMGASMLSAVGMPELIAHSEQEYVDIATSLAGDTARLADIRARLRPAMLASPLCDAVGYTRRLETAYRSMWQMWCAQSPSGARRG